MLKTLDKEGVFVDNFNEEHDRKIHVEQHQLKAGRVVPRYYPPIVLPDQMGPGIAQGAEVPKSTQQILAKAAFDSTLDSSEVWNSAIHAALAVMQQFVGGGHKSAIAVRLLLK